MKKNTKKFCQFRKLPYLCIAIREREPSEVLQDNELGA